MSINLEAMFKEIEMIRKKYGMPKSIGFVPDKLEITLERKEIDKFNLTYSEFFNYLPNHALNIAIETVIQFIQQMGLPIENILRIDNGVKLQISGDFKILGFPIIEMLLQNKGNESDIKDIIDRITNAHQRFHQFFDFYWNWSDEADHDCSARMRTMYNILQEHPSITSEINEVIEKYKFKK